MALGPEATFWKNKFEALAVTSEKQSKALAEALKIKNEALDLYAAQSASNSEMGREIVRLQGKLREADEKLLDVHKQYGKIGNDILRSYIENLSTEELPEPKFKIHQIVTGVGRPHKVNSRELKMTVGGSYAWFYTLEYYQGIVHENLLRELTEEEKG
jgi:hypothetical protein